MLTKLQWYWENCPSDIDSALRVILHVHKVHSLIPLFQFFLSVLSRCTVTEFDISVQFNFFSSVSFQDYSYYESHLSFVYTYMRQVVTAVFNCRSAFFSTSSLLVSVSQALLLSFLPLPTVSLMVPSPAPSCSLCSPRGSWWLSPIPRGAGPTSWAGIPSRQTLFRTR